MNNKIFLVQKMVLIHRNNIFFVLLLFLMACLE